MFLRWIKLSLLRLELASILVLVLSVSTAQPFPQNSTNDTARRDPRNIFQMEILPFLKIKDCVSAYDRVRKYRGDTFMKIKDRGEELPFDQWLYEVLKCQIENHANNGIVENDLNDYYGEVFRDHYLSRKDCSGAEQRMEKIRREQPEIFGPYLLNYTARCYENVDVKKSVSLYREIIKKHYTEPIHPPFDQEGGPVAENRINWLTGDRSWIFLDYEPLLDGVTKGLLDKNITLLEKYASKSNFDVGWWASESYSYTFKQIREGLLESLRAARLKIGPIEDKGNSKSLKISGWADDYSVRYFNFTKSDSGWQWTGWTYAQEAPGR